MGVFVTKSEARATGVKDLIKVQKQKALLNNKLKTNQGRSINGSRTLDEVEQWPG